MKYTLYPLIIAASLSLIAQTVFAQVLFSDNFNGITGPSGFPATPTTGANFDLGVAGRIGGSLTMRAGAAYINGFVRDGNEQLGHLTALSPNQLDNNVGGDNLLLANLGSDTINYDFSTINAPLAITFDGNVSSSSDTDWVSFMIGSLANSPFIVNVQGGILFRENGGTQTFNHGAGTDGATGIAPGNNVWQSYEIVLSDTAGTGSAFAGNGSLITYYANGVELGNASIDQLTAGQGYLGFGASDQLAGVDNISISTVAVPEPSVAMLLPAGFGLLALVRRYHRA